MAQDIEEINLIKRRIAKFYKNDDDDDQKWCNRYCMPARYVMAIWGFLGFTVVYTLRVNLSVALLAMVNNTAIQGDNETYHKECIGNSTPHITADGKFVWDTKIQGIILGAFFWGYIPLQIPAGWFAVRIGGKWLFGIGVLWTSLLTLLTPFAAEWGYGWLIGLRVLEGAGESITYPGMHSMLGLWSPAMETSFISGIVYSGSFAGLVVGLLGSGYLIQANVMGGWPSVFYIPGLVGVVWFIIWSLVAFSDPSKHPRISAKERRYIEISIEVSGENMNREVPWKEILTSGPVWAISVTSFCVMWSLYTFLTCLPQYFEYILDFSIGQNGLLNALPYFLSAIGYVVFSKLADIIRERGWLGTTATRKLFNTGGMVINAIFIIAITFIKCNNTVVVTFLCLAVALGSMNNSGYNINHIDIAPQFGGVLYGITNSIATVSGILGPYVVGALTYQNQTRERWIIVFYISSGITLFGALVYLIFGTGERQRWAIEAKEEEVTDSDYE